MQPSNKQHSKTNYHEMSIDQLEQLEQYHNTEQTKLTVQIQNATIARDEHILQLSHVRTTIILKKCLQQQFATLPLLFNNPQLQAHISSNLSQHSNQNELQYQLQSPNDVTGLNAINFNSPSTIISPSTTEPLSTNASKRDRNRVYQSNHTTTTSTTTTTDDNHININTSSNKSKSIKSLRSNTNMNDDDYDYNDNDNFNTNTTTTTNNNNNLSTRSRRTQTTNNNTSTTTNTNNNTSTTTHDPSTNNNDNNNNLNNNNDDDDNDQIDLPQYDPITGKDLTHVGKDLQYFKTFLIPLNHIKREQPEFYTALQAYQDQNKTSHSNYCLFCNKTVGSDYLNHINYHWVFFNENNTDHECPSCFFGFGSPHQLERHYERGRQCILYHGGINSRRLISDGDNMNDDENIQNENGNEDGDNNIDEQDSGVNNDDNQQQEQQEQQEQDDQNNTNEKQD